MKNYAIKCIDRLLQDLQEIEKGTISSGNYESAAEQWEAALFQRQYHGLKGVIEGLHSGPSFATAVEMLSDNLKQKREGIIKHNIQMIRAFGAQTKLPEVN